MVYEGLHVRNEVFDAELAEEFRRDVEEELLNEKYQKKPAYEKEELRLLEQNFESRRNHLISSLHLTDRALNVL